MKTIVFDLETKRLADEVGGWSNIDKLGLAAAVTYDVEHDKYSRFTEDQAPELIDELLSASRIVGFNVLRFDYVVLRPYGLQLTDDLRAKTIDMLAAVYAHLGFRLSLDNLAGTSLGEQKTADGLAAVRWYRAGKIEQVLDYCEQDVRVTYRLWRFGAEQGHLKYRDRLGNLRRVPATWA